MSNKRPLQVFPPGGGDALAEDGAGDLHVDAVEGAHAGLDPVLVDLGEEALDGLLGLGRGRVGGDAGAGARGDRRRAGRGGLDGLVQQQELDVARRHKARDVRVEEAIDVFEVPKERDQVSLSLLPRGTGQECHGEHLHLAGPPLHLLHNVERRVHDELVHVPRLLAETRLPVPALLRGPELVLEQRVVLRPDDDEVV